MYNKLSDKKIHYGERWIYSAGFNIGVNCGKTAGQSIFHAHIHVIPRYKGDVINPAGGVRRVIPYKNHQFFKNKKYTKRKVYL